MSNSLIISLAHRAIAGGQQAWQSSRTGQICLGALRSLNRTDRKLAAAGRSSRIVGLAAEDLPGKYMDGSGLARGIFGLASRWQQAAARRLPPVISYSRFMAWGESLRSASPAQAYALLNLFMVSMLAGNIIYHLAYAFDSRLLVIDSLLLIIMIALHGTDWQAAWASSRLKAVLEWLIDRESDAFAAPDVSAAPGASAAPDVSAAPGAWPLVPGIPAPINAALAKCRAPVLFLGLLLGLALSVIAGSSPYFPLYLLATAALLLALFKLEWGMVAMALVLPLLPSRVLMLVCALVICAFIYRLMRGTASFRIDPLGVWMLVFGLALLIPSLLSFSLYNSLQSMLAYGIYIVFYFVASSMIRDRRILYCFLLALLAGATLESAYGIYQNYAGLETTGENWVDIDEYPELSTRVFGTMDNPNVLALYLELCLPLAFAWMWTARGLLRKAFFAILTGLMALCMIYTASRTGWVAMAGSIFLFGLLYDRRILLAGFLGFAGLMAYSPLYISSRIQNLGGSGDSSFMYRTFVWSLCWNMVKDYWYAGIGLGSATFEKVYSLYYMREGVIAHHSHNLYMQLIIETGLFGITSFALLVGRAFAQGLALIRRALSGADAAMAAAVLSGMSAFLVHSLLEHSLYNYRIILAFFVMFIILSALLSIGDRSHRGDRSPGGDRPHRGDRSPGGPGGDRPPGENRPPGGDRPLAPSEELI